MARLLLQRLQSQRLKTQTKRVRLHMGNHEAHSEAVGGIPRWPSSYLSGSAESGTRSTRSSGSRLALYVRVSYVLLPCKPVWLYVVT